MALTPRVQRLIAACVGIGLVALAWFNTSLIQDRWMQAREQLTGAPPVKRAVATPSDEAKPVSTTKPAPPRSTASEPSDTANHLAARAQQPHQPVTPPAVSHVERPSETPLQRLPHSSQPDRPTTQPLHRNTVAEKPPGAQEPFPTPVKPSDMGQELKSMLRLPEPFVVAQAEQQEQPQDATAAGERGDDPLLDAGSVLDDQNAAEAFAPAVTPTSPVATPQDEHVTTPPASSDRRPPSVVSIDVATSPSDASPEPAENPSGATTPAETLPSEKVAPAERGGLGDDDIQWESELPPAASSLPEPAEAPADATRPPRTTPPMDQGAPGDAKDDRPLPIPKMRTQPPSSSNAWHLSLQQARRYSMENNKNVHVLRQDPAQLATTIQAEEAYFDPTVVMSARGGSYNRQVASLIQSFGGNFGSQRTDFLDGDEADTIGMLQRLRTGGMLSAGWLTEYQSLNPLGAFVIKNPAWYSRLGVSLEQPLLRGAGREVNEAPILIAAAQHTQAEADVRTAINEAMLAVETAYWIAVGAHREVSILNEIVQSSHQLWLREKEMLRIGKGSAPNVAQAEEQYHDFRIQQMESQLEFDESVRELLRVMGYPTTADVSVALATTPLSLDYYPNWEEAKYRMQQRPELVAQLAAVEAAEIGVRQASNGLRPDLALRAEYATTGLEENLDIAMKTMSRNQFNDWSIGLIYRHPLGRRADAAAAQAATVNLRREQLTYDQLQHDLVHQLRNAMQRVTTAREIAQLQTKRRISALEQFAASQELYEAGRVNLLDQLQAQQIASEARIDETDALIQFNVAVATWKFAQGDFEDCYQLATPTPASEVTSPAAPTEADPPQPETDPPQPETDHEDTTTAWLLPPL